MRQLRACAVARLAKDDHGPFARGHEKNVVALVHLDRSAALRLSEVGERCAGCSLGDAQVVSHGDWAIGASNAVATNVWRPQMNLMNLA